MQITHYDLKLNNILVNIIEEKISNNIVQHNVVKLIDLGISKIDIRKNLKVRKNRDIYRTLQHMALKEIRNSYDTVIMYPFKVDIYSFTKVYF